MDIKDKNLEIDPDLLNEWFEKLSLDPEPIPDLSGTLDNLDVEPENIHLVIGDNEDGSIECFSSENKCDVNNITENYFHRNIKLENEEDINISEKVTVIKEIVPSIFIKKEIQDEEDDIIKLEPETDSSSSDDESGIDLLARGGPVRLKKRSHKKKIYKPRVPVSPTEFESQKLLHYNSSLILENNSRFFQVQTKLPSSYKASNYSAPELDLLIKSPSNQQPNSPESGYDTSQSSAHSPSPPIADSGSLNFLHEDHDEAIKNIVKSLLEVEKHVLGSTESKQNTITHHSSCNNTELFANKNYEHIDLVKKNIAINLQNKNDLLNCSDNNLIDCEYFLAECADESLDLSIFINEQSNIPIDQNSNGTIGSMLGNTESVSIPLDCGTIPAKQEENCKRKISYTVGDTAKKALRYSDVFDVENYRVEEGNILRKIKEQIKRKEAVKVIDDDGREKFQILRQTRH